MRIVRQLLLVLAPAALACGDPVAGVLQPADTGQLVTIRNYQFLPPSLAVKPGSTVLIRNEDGFLHSVTSESAPGAFTPGAVGGVAFDTAPFTGTRSISVPASAPPGTVVPYYCAIHTKPEEQGQLVVASPAP